MAIEKLEFPATGTVAESWSPSANSIYAGRDEEEDLGISEQISAGNEPYNYGTALFTVFLRKVYESLSQADRAALQNFSRIVGGNEFKYTDRHGVPWKVTITGFRTIYSEKGGDLWDAEFLLRQKLKAHPSLSKIPAQFHRDLLLYAPLTSNFDVFTRWDGTATFTRSTSGTYRGSDGLLKTAAVNVARFDHFSGLEPAGVLLEGQRTNFLLRSEELDNAAWLAVRASVSPNIIAAPDGAVTGDKIVEDSTTGVHRVEQAFAKGANENLVISTWLQSAERTWALIQIGDDAINNGIQQYFNLAGSAVGSSVVLGTGWAKIDARIENWGNWRRCILTVSSDSGIAGRISLGPATGDLGGNYLGDGVSGVRAWGAQLERAVQFASSYIATTAATVTRNADFCTFLIAGHVVGEGAIVCVGNLLGTVNNQAFISIDGNSLANAIYLRAVQGPSRPSFVVEVNTVTQAAVSASAGADDFSVNTDKKIAGAWKTDDFELVSSGASRGVDTSGTVPSLSSLSAIRLGKDGDGTQQLFGHLHDLMIFARRLTAAEITAIQAAL